MDFNLRILIRPYHHVAQISLLHINGMFHSYRVGRHFAELRIIGIIGYRCLNNRHVFRIAPFHSVAKDGSYIFHREGRRSTSHQSISSFVPGLLGGQLNGHRRRLVHKHHIVYLLPGNEAQVTFVHPDIQTDGRQIVVEGKVVAILIALRRIHVILEQMAVRLHIVIVRRNVLKTRNLHAPFAHVGHHHVRLAVQLVAEHHAFFAVNHLPGVGIGKGSYGRLSIRTGRNLVGTRIPTHHAGDACHRVGTFIVVMVSVSIRTGR